MGSQAYGNGSYKRVNLYLRQALSIAFVEFFLITLIPAFFLDDVFYFLDVEEELINTSKQLIYWGLPAMFMKLISDNFKTFIVN